ncbi:lipid A biosynthesis acyltransferase [Malaciobacter molluscorum LMG 25693]|uniref:Lipid A biosynthesis acyltransferase n=1 Tax=Malaciobacter molluscorum LMG 25693 TaxID=870501 RepID=A0A2G1DJS3_9BACT|nr:lipid A biosynthesis lauroyl acyltransferase [Malaciobacter molluscorum]AXX92915.1 lipid A biosynthesis lauroyl acyltransferase [Malaciobacter molluscorum LMG 25693]PHO18747.1 lipid A biosynthesis acyltransferase [Malaciobacter molluscorum LMG 25693]
MKRKIKDYYRYILYNIFKFIILITPKFIAKQILIFIAYLANRFNKEHLHIANVNLDLVYGDSISKEKKDEIIFTSYKSLLFNLYEFVENQHISKEKLISKANIENEEVILNAIKDNRKIIYITAHYGGWEIALPYVALKYGKLAVVNRKMDNPYINDMYERARDRNNITMLEKKSAAKGMLKAFKEKKAVALVIDQHMKNGIEIQFFDKKVMATDATARLGLKFDAVIIPIFCVMNDFRDYTLKVGDMIDCKNINFKTEDHIKELTQMQSDLIEKQILEYPHLWFWQHKRWKKYYKNLYDRNKYE